MHQLLLILLLVLFILSLTSYLEELKKNPSEFIKKKILEFFTISVKDKQKIGTSYNDKDNIVPKGTFKIGNINAEKCYSTDTRSGNITKRINTYYCDQGIDGSEVIPYTDLSTIDFNNYNIHYGKIAKGDPLTGTFNNNGIVITLDKNGQVSNTLLSVKESKLFCDSMGDKCYGFITIIPTKTNNNNNATLFLKNTSEGWEDPDTYIKINVNRRNMNYHETNTNHISYIKKDVKYVEKPIDDNKLKSTSDKYINLATCNWKSGNRCIFKDYVYDQKTNSCISADGLVYNVPDINSYSQQGLNDWLTTLYKRDLGANKLTSEAINVNEYIQRCKEVNDYEFLASVPLPNPYIPTTKPGDVKGRYVRITINNANDNWLNFAELQVISDNKNIALRKPASASSTYNGTPPSRGNDGNSLGEWSNGSVAHNDNTGGPEYWEVDLGDASRTIDRVIISNRTDCCQGRLNNWLLSIYDYNKNLIWGRIYREAPNPTVSIDILNANNDKNNIRVKDYNQSRFNNYFHRISDTEFNSKRGWDGKGCYDSCHKEICEGEKKKWIGDSNWYGCRDYKPGELEAELAEKARIRNFSHIFTTAGATGRNGPTLAQIRSAYSNASWAQDSNYLNMTTQGIQEWKVPVTGSYSILAWGAVGGSSSYGKGGRGTHMRTMNVILTKGEVIKILVGQKGIDMADGGGGGGTFVMRNGIALVVAGGGGGAGGYNKSAVTQNGMDASNDTSGTNGYPGSGQWFTSNGMGGQSGNGGTGGVSHRPGGGGGGITGDGKAYTGNFGGGGYGFGGKSFSNGGEGGMDERSVQSGGFGGGGGAALGGGGGGGYSGGGGGIWGGYSPNDWGKGGGGGGSYIIPSMSSYGPADHNGDGKVTITFVSGEITNPGITIYSEPEYNGKSLLLKPGTYDATFFNNNWRGLGIGSYKSTDDGNYMIGFGFTGGGGAGGGTIVKNLNNWSKVFGGNYSTKIFDGITNFSIWTAEGWKKYMCTEAKQTRFSSHWADFPSSDC